MAAKAPHAYPANASGNDAHPSTSLGTPAVNQTTYHDGHPLRQTGTGTGTGSGTSGTCQSPGGNGYLEPSASSSSLWPQAGQAHHRHQDFYAPSSSSYNQTHPFSPPDDFKGQTAFNTQANTQHDVHLRGPQQTSPYQDHNRLYAPVPTRPTGKFTEEWDASRRGSSIINGPIPRHTTHDDNSINKMSSIHRSNSFSGSTTGGAGGFMDGSSIQMSRSNTLKKKSSLRRSGSLKRSGSRRSMKAGSVRSLALQSNADEDEMHSAFFCPVPTTANPTEALADRFHAWRKILKDLITYFKEIQTHYGQQSKSLLKLANVLNNVHMPPGFLTTGGLDDAVQILRNYNSQSILEANKAREIEEDVILALTGLRSDLQLKIKEIKNLSGDFKNSVEKEMETTRRAVKLLQENLGKSELDSALTTGKEDPYLLRLAVDRQLERQLDEENYLHQAYLNLENSGRELESIVVGEIQKSYNAYAGILRREADIANFAIEELRVGPIAMPKDHEWADFVRNDDQFVDPAIPIRSFQYIHYPGKDHFACQEIRAGLLERKTKYLKSYTAGWYVLSPTHLHEFKSADKTQSPVMSLYLPEQKLGSHSQESGSSPKFILKGRQTGGVHRGHSWVFRAESYDTMLAWYEDIKALTEKTPQERHDFVRGHSRSFSRTSSRRSVSSDGVVDEDDDEPYSAHTSAAALGQPGMPIPGSQQDVARRPSPGGRFPSDIEVNAQRGLQAPLSPSSSMNASGSGDHKQQGHQQVPQQQQQYPGGENNIIAAAGALPGSDLEQHYPSTEGAEQNGYFQAPPQTNYINQSYQSQANEVLYASHPAPISAARAEQNDTAGDDEERELAHKRLSSHEASWLAGGPVEEAAIPALGGRSAEDSYATTTGGGLEHGGLYVDGSSDIPPQTHANGQPTVVKDLPRTTVVSVPFPANGAQSLQHQKRPAVSDRTESDAPTLSSEAATISHLHVPGQYPKGQVGN